MRVIAGEFRSRSLKTLPGGSLRPTPDRLRESLFNILANRIEGSVFMDAYAGSGSVGIEAISRGAAAAIFVEKRFAAARIIRENIAELGIQGRATVVQGSTHGALSKFEADIYFLDPPYTMPNEYQSALDLLGEKKLRPGALVIAQHPKRLDLEEEYGTLRRVRQLSQGDNTVSFFE